MLSWIKIALGFVSRLSGNSPQIKKWIAVFVALLVLAWATKCHGAEPELSIEAGSTYVRGEAPALALTVRYPEAGPLDTDYVFGIVLNGSSTLKGESYRNQAAVHAQLVDGWGPVEIGLGVAYLQGIDAYNGSHGNFSLSLAYNVTDRLAIVVRHFSNLGTVLPNLGRDYLLAAYRF